MQPVTWEAVVAALIGGVLGGGSIAAIGYRALKDRLAGDLERTFVRVFASRDDVNALGGRVNGLVTVATMAKDTSDANSDAIIRLQEGEKYRWEPMLRLLEKMEARLNSHEQQITKTTTILDAITRRLDIVHKDRGAQ